MTSGFEPHYDLDLDISNPNVSHDSLLLTYQNARFGRKGFSGSKTQRQTPVLFRIETLVRIKPCTCQYHPRLSTPCNDTQIYIMLRVPRLETMG